MKTKTKVLKNEVRTTTQPFHTKLSAVGTIKLFAITKSDTLGTNSERQNT